MFKSLKKIKNLSVGDVVDCDGYGMHAQISAIIKCKFTHGSDVEMCQIENGSEFAHVQL